MKNKSIAIVILTSALLLGACGQGQQGPKGEQVLQARKALKAIKGCPDLRA